MSRQAIAEYIKGLIQLYKNASKTEKSTYLDQAQIITGKSRRTISRYLNEDFEVIQKGIKIQGRGREVIYPPQLLLPHLRLLWRRMEMISAERMVVALPKWLPFYKDEECTFEIRRMILSMSRCTLDRLLAQLRKESISKRGLSTTASALHAVKARVPIGTLNSHVTRPGFTQADTVSHCGTTTAGAYISSLTLTDLFSGWTENRALPNKTAIEVRKAFIRILQGLPFQLKAINTDSGSEFINTPMIEYLTTPLGGGKILFTRSRPYRKNDNCYVEQRNYTHVRQLFGYYRLENGELVDLMNHIYSDYWNPLHNYFLPSQKLIEKVRVGSKIVKKHDFPKTPADRLLASEHMSAEEKKIIQKKFESLNPIELSQTLELKLKEFFTRYQQSIIRKEAA